MKTVHTLIIAFAVLLMTACSKDDDMRPLKATSGSSSFDVLNDCDIGSGSNATSFTFEIELDSPPMIELGGVEFDLKWSDGDESDDAMDDDIIITGSTVAWDWCFRFGGTDWFEIKAVVLDDNLKAASNEVTIRVNKPAGAN